VRAVFPHRELITLFGLAEPLSSLTHLLAAAAMAAYGAPLVRRGKDVATRTALLLFVVFVLSLFVSSAVYHGLSSAHPLRDLFWRLDHATIWVGLAATFTAVRFAFLDGKPTSAVAWLWGVAIAGVTLEMASISRLEPWVSPTLYILMGWCGLPTVLQVGRAHGWSDAGAMLFGGCVVTVGGIMDATSWPDVVPGFVEAHELLHVTTIYGGLVFFHRLWRGAGAAHAPPAAAHATVETIEPA
jgi:channel protein (hemolysin III family)